jgi:bifunctional non-homologous end joining protein LigD
MLQRTLPAGFIAPCLPTKTTQLPSGSQWLHEIKHDGFRIIARKSNGRVRLYSRPGNDFTRRFPLIVEALERLRSHSCIIDGEAVACDDNGVASFDLVRHHVIRLVGNPAAVDCPQVLQWAVATAARPPPLRSRIARASFS